MKLITMMGSGEKERLENGRTQTHDLQGRSSMVDPSRK